MRSNVSTGRGMYKSTDGGQTWKFIGLYNAGQIGAVRIHPTNPDIVWVAAGGDIFKSNDERGVFKTTDGGQTWRKVLFISDSHWRDGCRVATRQSERCLCVDVAARTQAMDDHQRLSRRWFLQKH